MNSTVGILCARVRVEEKQMVEAFALAGVSARPLPPVPTPVSLPPVPCQPLAAAEASGEIGSLVIDRCQDRVLAAALLPLLRATGVEVMGSGLAAAADRLAVATALATAGIPRPRTMLIASEATGLAALETLGYPATVLPLTTGEAEVSLCDKDIAEAVLEHRNVLGGSRGGVALIQAGGCDPAFKTTVFVAGGTAVGYRSPSGRRPGGEWLRVAEQTAAVLGAEFAGVELVAADGGPVVWDVLPVPEFRDAEPVGQHTVAEAIAAFVSARPGAATLARQNGQLANLELTMAREEHDGIVLSA